MSPVEFTSRRAVAAGLLLALGLSVAPTAVAEAAGPAAQLSSSSTASRCRTLATKPSSVHSRIVRKPHVDASGLVAFVNTTTKALPQSCWALGTRKQTVHIDTVDNKGHLVALSAFQSFTSTNGAAQGRFELGLKAYRCLRTKRHKDGVRKLSQVVVETWGATKPHQSASKVYRSVLHYKHEC